MAGQTIDYDALAKQHGAVSSTVDYDALAKEHGAITDVTGGAPTTTNTLDNPKNKLQYTTPEGIPVYSAGEDEAWKQPEGSAARRGASGLWDTTAGGLLGMLKTAAQLGDLAIPGEAFNPNSPGYQAVMGLVQPHIDQAEKAKAALAAGRTSEAIGHTLATITPLIGPAAAHAGEQFGTDQLPQFDKYGNVTKQGQLPDIARGVGESVGLAGTASAPLVKGGVDALEGANSAGRSMMGMPQQPLIPSLPLPSINVPGPFRNPNAMEREAYDYMRNDVGTAPNAGMATGSTFVQGSQKLSGYTPAGAYMDAKAAGRDIEALRARATRLTSEAMPEEGPSKNFYGELERLTDGAPAVEVPLSIAKDGSQISGNVKVPVDIRDLKYDMQPLFERMEMIPGLDKNTSWAYSTLKALLNSNDFITLPTAEFALGNFKKAARNEPGGISQAIVKSIIPKFQAVIDGAAEGHLGDEGLTALQKGRAAAAKEAGAEWLSDQFGKAQQEGGFGHEKVLWNNWTKLTDTSKRTMFTPQQIAELNKLFLGLKMRADNPNPSGTALVGAISGQAAALGTAVATGQILNPFLWLSQLGIAGFAKLLRTDGGVKLLTDGLQIPRNSARGRFIANRLNEALGKEGNQEPPEQGPPSGGRPGGGGPPPVAPGMVRVYRGEDSPGTGAPAPDWVTQSDAYKASQQASGRSWVTDPELAKWYVNDAGEGGRMVYQDVPASVAEKSRVQDNPEARRYSRDPENELFLPAEYAGKGKPVPSGGGQPGGQSPNPARDAFNRAKKAADQANPAKKLWEKLKDDEGSVKIPGAAPEYAYRSTQKPADRVALNDAGVLYTTPNEAYSKNWGPHTQRLEISPHKTLDFTRFRADQVVGAPEMKSFLEKHGVRVSPALASRLAAAEEAGGEVLQHFGQFGKRELVEAIKRAGYDSAKINEYVEGGGRSTSTLLFDPTLAKQVGPQARPL
jgi:hypothetical protein